MIKTRDDILEEMLVDFFGRAENIQAFRISGMVLDDECIKLHERSIHILESSFTRLEEEGTFGY